MLGFPPAFEEIVPEGQRCDGDDLPARRRAVTLMVGRDVLYQPDGAPVEDASWLARR
jgi:hypothetical protein